MDETNFDRLLHRYLHNQLSNKEKRKFEAWLDVLHKENDTDLELSKADQEKLFIKITSEVASVDDVIALYPRQSGIKQFFSQQWVQIAASVLIMLSASFAVWSTMDRATLLQAFTPDDREKTILNDGTIVWLQENSKLTYYEKDGSRYAALTGEALFEVAKIPGSEFTIACGNIRVKVLGTSFSLKTGQERVELKVLTGKVKLTSIGDKVGVDVRPNEKVIYAANGQTERLKLSGDDVSIITGNTEYNMKFRGASMEEVVKGISRKFDVTIHVTNKDLNKCHISADFTDKSLESTLTILTDLLDVTYRINGKSVELSGKGC